MNKRVNIPEHIRRHPAVFWSRVRARWPFFIWVLAIVAAVFLFYHGGQFSGMSGTVDVVREEIAPLETARLLSIDVTTGQHVKQGDVLARMDTTILDTEMAVEKLQIDRQFAMAVSRAEAGLRDARIRQAESEGELEVLNTEIARLEGLLANRLVDAQTVARLRSRQQALVRAVQLYPDMITSLEEERTRIQSMRGDVETHLGSEPDVTMTNAAVLSEIDVAASRQRIGLLGLRREAYTLRAGANGTVSLIYHEPGDVVQGGLPVMTLIDDSVKSVIGFLPEANSRMVEVGMTAYLHRSVAGSQVIPARVTALLPEILQLPSRVSPVRAQPYRGRRVILQPLAVNDFLPGESVTIELRKPWLSVLMSKLIRQPAVPPGGGN